jgi:hypothetical protein
MSHMPQPLNKVIPHPTLDLWGVSAIPEREHLALLYAQAISSWVDVEAYQLILFVTLMRNNETTAAKIYLALDTARAKGQALSQVIDTIADERQRAVVKAVTKLAKTMEKTRDKLAHQALGICNKLPDALLIVDLKDVISKAEIDYGEIQVYREKDFLNVIATNLRLCEYLKNLREISRSPRSEGGCQLLDQLYNTPEIQERLDHRLRNRNPF